MKRNDDIEATEYFDLLKSVKEEIRSAQYRAMIKANTERNILYWKIGRIIIDNGNWGNKFIERLSHDLRSEYPGSKGYSVRNLAYMRQFAEKITNTEILQQVVAKLSWKAITILIDKTQSYEEYLWYSQMSLENSWSVNVMTHQVESKLYERQILTNKTTNLRRTLDIKLGEQADEIIKDPYVFDFLSENTPLKEIELENALTQQVTKLLLEFGSGFAFMGHQYHIKVGNRDFYIDLLFYNTKLHCYFVVELKTGEFEPEYTGKLSFYLTAVDETLKSDSDNRTIGLLLCKSKDRTVAEYALRDIDKPMGISEYRLSAEIREALPSIEEIKEKLKP